MASEGSPSVPQQPVGRWHLIDDEDDGVKAARWPNTVHHGSGDAIAFNGIVQPALVAERLAEALRNIRGMYFPADDDARVVWASSVFDQARAALSAYESGGATKPGEES